MKSRTIFLMIGVMGSVVVMALLLSQLRAARPTLRNPPATLSIPSCAEVHLALKPPTAGVHDLADLAETLTRLWGEQGWRTTVDIRSDAQVAELTARRAGQSFQAQLLVDGDIVQLVASGSYTCTLTVQP
ncbi:hypothetical protein ANRL2_01244 [Anaerolineae bacterium]|nr:hypothetical protein ANRL2_01244 [Anaerolineae bacterium]